MKITVIRGREKKGLKAAKYVRSLTDIQRVWRKEIGKVGEYFSSLSETGLRDFSELSSPALNNVTELFFIYEYVLLALFTI